MSHLSQIEVSWSPRVADLLTLLVRERLIDSYIIVRGSYKGYPMEGRNKRVKIFLNIKTAFNYRYSSTYPTISGVSGTVGNTHSPYSHFRMVSSPSRPQYKGLKWLTDHNSWHKLYIVSTDRGFVTSSEAIRLGVGGLIICLFTL
jgi:ribosomal protein S8